jgi:endonuclease-3 related protein
MAYKRVFKQLLKHYGPQAWWPAETPFEVMVGAVLTQNTAWSNVEKAIENLQAAQSLTPQAILETSPAKLAKWLKPSGYFNIKAKRLRNFCAWYVSHGQYRKLKAWPTAQLRQGLLSVNGIGPETADDILLYAFHRPVFVIDAYTRRLFSRLGVVQGDEPYEVLRAGFEKRLGADAGLYNEYHALIVMHAKGICRKKPLCSQCILNKGCNAVRA